MILNCVLSFYLLDNDNPQLLKEESSKFYRGSFDFRYGQPVTLPDAANYAKEEWDKVNDETTKNVFIKVDLRISLDIVVTETFDNNEFLNIFKNFNTTVTEQGINEFVAIDDESSCLYQVEILEEVKSFFSLKKSKQ